MKYRRGVVPVHCMICAMLCATRKLPAALVVATLLYGAVDSGANFFNMLWLTRGGKRRANLSPLLAVARQLLFRRERGT